MNQKSQPEEPETFGVIAGQSKQELMEKLDHFIHECESAGNIITKIKSGDITEEMPDIPNKSKGYPNSVTFYIAKIWYRRP